MEKKRPMAYRLALHDSLKHVNDVFHVSVLRHYVFDLSHVIDICSLQVSDEGSLMAEPIRILYHHTRQLGHLIVNQVKVQWDNYSPHSTTWEDAYEMRQ
jgi:tRNA(Met) C34 N-acetyltransferase TmcA